jgi:hypothetical protein
MSDRVGSITGKDSQWQELSHTAGNVEGRILRIYWGLLSAREGTLNGGISTASGLL